MSEGRLISNISPFPDQKTLSVIAGLISGRTSLAEVPDSSWSKISRHAVRQGLGPLLWWKLASSEVPQPLRSALSPIANASKIASFNYQLLKESQNEVQTALSQAGIPIIWLKGIALAQTLYPRPELRPMDDLDLLVQTEHREAALDRVQALGYQFPQKSEMAQKMGGEHLAAHHYHLHGGPSGSQILELHFRLPGGEPLLKSEDMEWFLQQVELATACVEPFTVLKPEANLLYLSAHTILQHGEAEFRLQRYYDLHLVANQPGMDWDLVINRAADLGWTYEVERACSLARHYFDTPVPKGVLEELHHRSPSQTNTRSRRLQGPGHRWEGTLINLSEIPLKERMRKLFYLVFPPSQFMRTRYRIPEGKPLFIYYFYRWLDAAGEILGAGLNRLGWIKNKSLQVRDEGYGWALPNSVLADLIRESLGKGNPFTFRALGWSMSPFIRHGDDVTVSPLQGRKPAVGQVVAFIQPGTEMILVHRIILKKKSEYLMQGDNMPGRNDGMIPVDRILGGVSQVERGGQEVWFGRGLAGTCIALLSRRGLLAPLVSWLGKLFGRH